MSELTCEHCRHLTVAEAWIGEGRTEVPMTIPGTLRDYFAAKAMPYMLSLYDMAGKNNVSYQQAAEEAFGVADAMLAAREGKKDE